MHITIEHKGVKRVIDGTGFNICASKEDLQTIVDAITRANVETYGWLKVRDPEPDEHSTGGNSKPLQWNQ